MLKGKHILLGVCGGIAAYKSAWLVRELIKAGAEVQVVMTRNATQFITPLTLSTLSQREVVMEMFPSSPEQPTPQWTRHIELGLWADIMFIAPATANTLAKIVYGIADDFLSTLVLALRCPLALAPAMDVDMYRNDATQRNIDALKQSGCFVIDPEEGELASGLSGPGRLPEIGRLVQFVDGILERVHQNLRGRRILVTAGPTYEPIDPVRYIGNRSSGRMGFAIAAAAAHRGAEVTLVSGPVGLPTPRTTRRVDVETATEMQKAVEEEYARADAVIMSAAVADFAPVQPQDRKIKREVSETLQLELRKNPDILKALGEKKTRQVLVGFALETHDAKQHALQKLKSKNLDMIVMNAAGMEGAGFGVDTNIVTIMMADGRSEDLPKMAKYDVAHALLDRIVPLFKS